MFGLFFILSVVFLSWLFVQLARSNQEVSSATKSVVDDLLDKFLK